VILAAVTAVVLLTPLLAGATPREADVRAKMASLQKSLNDLATRMDAADAALDFAQARIAQHQRQLRDANLQLAPLRSALANRATQLYIMGSNGMVETAFGSSNLETLLDRTTYLELVSTGERSLVEQLTAVSRRARIETKLLQSALADAEAARRSLLAQRHKLDGMFSDYQQLLNLLALNSRTVVRASRYRGAAIVCPVAGPHGLDNNFGAPRPGGPHTGDDLPSPYGTPVVAVANGAITQIVYGGWMGLGIIMRDVAGNEWWYAHLSARSVSSGEHVSQGEQIGNVGCSGNCSGPHLHFEYHPGGGAPANPYPILRPVC